MEIQNRRMHIVCVTAPPNGTWAAQQARSLLMDIGERAARFRFPSHDRDSKFAAAFDKALAGNAAQIVKTPVRSRRAKVCEQA